MGFSGSARSWWVPPIGGPSHGAPSPRLFRPRTRRANRPLTLPVVDLGEGPKPRSKSTRTVSTAASSKDNGFSSPERLPPTSARSAPLSRHLEREPATRRSGLGRPTQASDAFSPPVNGRARHRRFRKLIACERSTPRAARRLLQSIRSQARPSNRRNSRLQEPCRLSLQVLPA